MFFYGGKKLTVQIIYTPDFKVINIILQAYKPPSPQEVYGPTFFASQAMFPYGILL